MLTLFASPKPFADPHVALIQRNAILSWAHLAPRPEIFLVGDAAGVADLATELRVPHIRDVPVNESGTPLLDGVFAAVEKRSRADHFCYMNADIILMDDFPRAVDQVLSWNAQAVLVGDRIELDVRRPLDFERDEWQVEIRDDVKRRGERLGAGPDFVVYARGALTPMPPFAIGRTTFDNWFMWRAVHDGRPVVNVGKAATIIHQVHSGAAEWAAMRGSVEARANRALASEWACSYTLEDCTHELVGEAVVSRRSAMRRHRAAAALAIGRNRGRAGARALLNSPPVRATPLPRLLRGRPSRD